MYSDGVVEVNAVEEEFLKEPVKVYNLEAEDWHDYYVSELDVLVHNCDGGSSNFPQIAGEDNLGYLSGIGESNNNPRLISSGRGVYPI